jgi:hypothetical protein
MTTKIGGDLGKKLVNLVALVLVKMFCQIWSLCFPACRVAVYCFSTKIGVVAIQLFFFTTQNW